MLTKKKAVKLEQRIEENKEIADMVKDIEEDFNEDIIDQYHKLASELGYSTPQIVREKLLRFLKKNNLKVYDRLKVEAFLDGQYGETATGTRGKTGWCWVGLTAKQNDVSESRKPSKIIMAREKVKKLKEEKRRKVKHKTRTETVGGMIYDTSPMMVWRRNTNFSTFATGSPRSDYSGDIESGRTYKSEIPMRVLQLVSAIKTEIPELSFFVSTVAIPKPDPFLYVTCEGMEGEIISHWDEPGFVG